jgi:hypothetical protein
LNIFIYSLSTISITIILGVTIGILLYNHLSGRNIILDTLDRHRLSKLTLQNATQFWQNNTNTSSIIICLTTIPSRIHSLEPTLISLLTQTNAPKEIRLHIPHHSKRENIDYTIPKKFIDIPGITIIRCNDYGPATKSIPAIESLPPNQPLLIVDDDYLYPPNLVARYETLHLKNPDIIIGSSGWIVPNDLTDKPTTLWTNLLSIPPTPILCPRIKQPVQIDIIQGFSGYLIQPQFFDSPQLKDYKNTPNGIFFVDDVWISAHSKAKKWVFPEKRFCFDPKKANNLYKSSSLGKINRGEGTNESRNNTIAIRYFKDRWLFNKKRSNKKKQQQC